ncbi:MAG: alpha/beta hydrolase, partial [Bacteroidia bacterium]
DFLLEPGKSVCSAEIKHTDQIVEWYYEIFDKLKLKKVNIVGASRGGWLAINIALRNKARINKMALLSPAQTFTWIKLGPKTLFNIAYSVFPKRKKFRNVMETVTVDVDKINQLYLNQYYLATKKGIFHKCFLQMTPFPEKELKLLKMPILVLIGDHDIINNDKSLKRAKQDFLNIRTKEIKNSGHFLSIDQPEIVDKLLIDFLK